MSEHFHRPIAILARRQPAWRWTPDTWAEAADAWLWRHPKLHALSVAAIYGLLMFAFVRLICRRAGL
jgi:hypothetical protein